MHQLERLTRLDLSGSGMVQKAPLGHESGGLLVSSVDFGMW